MLASLYSYVSRAHFISQRCKRRLQHLFCIYLYVHLLFSLIVKHIREIVPLFESVYVSKHVVDRISHSTTPRHVLCINLFFIAFRLS